MARLGKEHLGGMSQEGERVKQRRERGQWFKVDVARLAKVSRNTLTALEAGSSFNRTTLAKVEKALDELEHEAGMAPFEESQPTRHGAELESCEHCGQLIWPSDYELMFDVLGAYLNTLTPEERLAAFGEVTRGVVKGRLGRPPEA